MPTFFVTDDSRDAFECVEARQHKQTLFQWNKAHFSLANQPDFTRRIMCDRNQKQEKSTK
jgi:hypothetical protein